MRSALQLLCLIQLGFKDLTVGDVLSSTFEVDNLSIYVRNSTYIESNPCSALVLHGYLYLKILSRSLLLDQAEQFGAALGIDIELSGDVAYGVPYLCRRIIAKRAGKSLVKVKETSIWEAISLLSG
ncbi:MAG: hypothetical protein WAW37_02280 [Syntrophobacteraceae bacterium]